jgi:hypothetical protein
VDAPCPECGQPVTGWTFTPGYVMVQESEPLWEGGPAVAIPGTERPVRVLGIDGPEFALKPCGHQFYELRFMARAGVIFEITGS